MAEYHKFTHDGNYNWDLQGYGTVIKDIPYGDLSENYNKLDIYLPAIGVGNFPVIVYVHGGGFFQGDKTHHISGHLQGLKRGYAVACINYRLGMEAPYPAFLEDVCEGLRFLKANAGEYHLDKKRFAFWGDTHGGYIAGRIAIDAPKGNLDFLKTIYPSEDVSVCGTVSFYGPMDQYDFITRKINSGEPEEIEFAEKTRKYVFQQEDFEKQLIEQNPIPRIDGNECPFYLLHGREDFNIPQKYTKEFADKLTEKKVKHILNFVEGGLHAIDSYDNERDNEAIMKFFDEVFGHGNQ